MHYHIVNRYKFFVDSEHYSKHLLGVNYTVKMLLFYILHSYPTLNCILLMIFEPKTLGYITFTQDSPLDPFTNYVHMYTLQPNDIILLMILKRKLFRNLLEMHIEINDFVALLYSIVILNLLT